MAKVKEMRCKECGGALPAPRIEPTLLAVKLPYEVWVEGHVRECSNGHRAVSIPRLGSVLHELAQFIANLPRSLVPEEVNHLRRHLGWSQRDLAAALGVEPTTVSKWENGRTRMGSTAERFLRHLARTGVEAVDYDELDRTGVPNALQLTGNAAGPELHVVEKGAA